MYQNARVEALFSLISPVILFYFVLVAVSHQFIVILNGVHWPTRLQNDCLFMFWFLDHSDT